MTRTDFKAFSNLMQALADCYGKTLSAQGIALRFQLLAPGKGSDEGGQTALEGLLHHLLQAGFLTLGLGHQGGDGGILVFQHSPLC